MKLKKLLEGFAWERKPGAPLPTMKDVAKQHQQNEASVFTPGDDFGGGPGRDLKTEPKDVQKLVDKLKSNQAIKLAVKRINMKNEVAPAIIAFAQLLNDQVPNALTTGKLQQIIKAMKEME
tara:strand:+ start:222 stop:584 length:363 start_codon:yes stop_codon:yes gene_type:complete